MQTHRQNKKTYNTSYFNRKQSPRREKKLSTIADVEPSKHDKDKKGSNAEPPNVQQSTKNKNVTSLKENNLNNTKVTLTKIWDDSSCAEQITFNFVLLTQQLLNETIYLRHR